MPTSLLWAAKLLIANLCNRNDNNNNKKKTEFNLNEKLKF